MDSRVRINVGGQVFETALATVEAGGPDCILCPMLDKAWSRERAHSGSEEDADFIPEIFIDRDPVLFRSLLNLLRTSYFDPPPGARLETILAEADYFGLLDAVKKAWEPPAFNATNSQQVASLNRQTGSTCSATCLAAGADGSLCVGHGSQLSTYDWTLHLQQSITTNLPQVDCIHHLSETRVIVGGSCSSDLLPIYDIREGSKLETVSCNGSHAVVRSIASSDRFLFVASLRKTVGAEWGVGKAVAVLDKGTLQSAAGGGAAPITTRRLGGPDKVEWMEEWGLLLVMRSFEYCKYSHDEATYLRLWDPRSDTLVYDWREGANNKRMDACCDAIAVPQQPYVIKLSPVNAVGRDDISFIDLRKLSGIGIGTSQMVTSPSGIVRGQVVGGGDDAPTWTSLEGQDPPLNMTRVRGRCHLLALPNTKQVVVSKGMNAEVWTTAGGILEEETKVERVGGSPTSPYHRSNVVALLGSEWIRNMAIGGERLFVSREGPRSVEVWETRGKERLPAHLLNI